MLMWRRFHALVLLFSFQQHQLKLFETFFSTLSFSVCLNACLISVAWWYEPLVFLSNCHFEPTRNETTKHHCYFHFCQFEMLRNLTIRSWRKYHEHSFRNYVSFMNKSRIRLQQCIGMLDFPPKEYQKSRTTKSKIWSRRKKRGLGNIAGRQLHQKKFSVTNGSATCFICIPII